MLRTLYRPRFADFKNDRALAIYAFLAGVIITLMYRPFIQVESGDQSIWDYLAQSILRGQIPYRDVIEIKTPLSAYMSALMIAIFRPLGVSDIYAIRLLYVLLVGVMAATTFSVAKVYLKSRCLGLIAVLTLLMSDHFISWMFSGTEPKLWMILFGLFTLLLIASDQPFLAGVCSALSFLSWQPGLLFTGTAVLVLSNYFTRWRDGRAVKVLFGASLPILLLIIYFYANGALDDLWKWTIEYNYKVYAPMTHKADSGIHLATIFFRVFRDEIILPILSLIGLVILIKNRVKTGGSGEQAPLVQNAFGERNAFGDALWIAPVIYLLFCLINLQAGPDLIPIFPFVGIFAGFSLMKFSAWLQQKYPPLQNSIAGHIPTLAIVVMLVIALARGYTYLRQQGSPLAEQIESLNAIKKELGEGDRIYTHGATEILVLLNRANANPYIFLDFGKDDFIAAPLPDGFRSFIAALEAQKPKLVIFSRLRKVGHREDLINWAETHYNKFAVVGYDETYIRKPNQ